MTGHDSDLGGMRRDYVAPVLRMGQCDADPLVQFQRWFAEAEAALAEGPKAYRHPNVMTLATANADGAPSARVVLLKGIDARGFVFYTDRESRKGEELRTNPRAALVFHWAIQERQVRVEGTISQTTRAEDEAYFASRPRGSRVSAATSHQSHPIASRDALASAQEAMNASLGDAGSDTPARWGGYRLTPTRLEFWQGNPQRLHDRICYERDGDTFVRSRLQP